MLGEPSCPLALLHLLWLLLQGPSGVAENHGNPGPLRCYRVGPRGDLACFWGSLGDQEAPWTLHLESKKYHPGRNWTVVVPPRQTSVTVPREHFTTADWLLVWGTTGNQSLWAPILVNLGTQRVKPDPPTVGPKMDFSEDDPWEARIQWIRPSWPPHESLICRFYYRLGQEEAWTQLDPDLSSISLDPVEIRDLHPDSTYKVRGQCRVDTAEEELWGEASPVFSFLTAPKDVWLSGHSCGVPSGQEPLLLWKAPMSSVPTNYKVWFQVEDALQSREGVPCCHCPIPAHARSAAVSLDGVSSLDPITNLSLSCLAASSAPRNVLVNTVARGKARALLVTWIPSSKETWEHVVDWVPDTDKRGDLSWVRLPPENLSVLLPGNFEGGVPYRITVTTVSPQGLASAPSVWVFREEQAPLRGPTLQRLQDASSGTPTITWDEVPRHELRGHLTHYTLCVRTEKWAAVSCRNVTDSNRTLLLPSLPWGSCEVWMTASTRAGEGPPGPSLWFHLPDNTLLWKMVPVFVILSCAFLMGLVYKIFFHRVWEKTPDPANSRFYCGQNRLEELPAAQPPVDLPFLEVQEVEPLPQPEPPQAPRPLNTGYEKHFLPTPEELGLLAPYSPVQDDGCSVDT